MSIFTVLVGIIIPFSLGFPWFLPLKPPFIIVYGGFGLLLGSLGGTVRDGLVCLYK